MYREPVQRIGNPRFGVPKVSLEFVVQASAWLSLPRRLASAADTALTSARIA